MGPSSGHSSPELSRLAVSRPSVAISFARTNDFGCRLPQIPQGRAGHRIDDRVVLDR